MAKDPELRAHQEWLGYVQPVGLVVSAPALLAAQAHINKNIIPDHERFLQWVPEVSPAEDEDTVLAITDLPGFLHNVFSWERGDLIGSPGAEALPDSLEVTLPEYNETLRPTYAVKEVEPQNGASPWLMLTQVLQIGTDFDLILQTDETRWQASPQARFERLLRETQVAIGLLFNGTHLRLVYAPRGETSGHVTFSVRHMSEVGGRPIFAALHLLLSADRLFSLARNQRLSAILAESRKYQTLVSTQLSEQVLRALYELLRGFHAADDHAKGNVLREALQEDPDLVYGGLLTVLLRLVFILYAEDRGLLSNDPVYVNQYSVGGLFERLRDDDNRYPDTMDQRYGAWAQLLTLFRLIHSGVRHGNLQLPPRYGGLFDSDRYKFLEGRPYRENNQEEMRIEPPMISDGAIYRVLNDLLILDGERLSYRTLDVEEIGSVYQTVMGFHLEVTAGPSIAITGKRKHKGEVPAPTVINLEELLSISGKDRTKWLRELTEQELPSQTEEALKSSTKIEDLLAALERKIARGATPHVVPKAAIILQPTDERRRSGSHYTPRSFTEPIVRTTLRPVLQRLGERPTPNQILDLKICDMAVGSAAFLVETCRQLGDELVKAWHHHGDRPSLPPDETEELLARRLIAQRCIYGVDRNPMAVDLAKLALWLATLAKDHPFTFLDHAIRSGDSLVGLTRRQIADFHWREEKTRAFGEEMIEKRTQKAAVYRKEILDAGDFVLPELKRQKLALADTAIELVRFAGDCVVAAFFSGDTDRARNEERTRLLDRFTRFVTKSDVTAAPNDAVKALRSGQFPVTPFHWEIDFPEVFDHENPGFDAVVGNPPFLGGKDISGTLSSYYLDWLHDEFTGSSGQVDLVTFFVRRAFDLIRNKGTFGLLSTKTISQGDSRRAGLVHICKNGGMLFNATKRIPWPGAAAVTVSAIFVAKQFAPTSVELDGKTVEAISPYLVPGTLLDEPTRLVGNQNKAFMGYYNYGEGFIFDDNATNSEPLCRMVELLANNPRNKERIFPFIGGEELLESPSLQIRRYVIDFGSMSEKEARNWPELFEILERRVKPERASCNRERLREFWWQFGEVRPGLRDATVGKSRLLMHPFTSKHLAFAFVPSSVYVASPHYAIVLGSFSSFAALQSRAHELWARFFASSLEDRLRYTASDCFETFPFPIEFEANQALECVGREYYEFRAALMVKNNEGLTKTYNRFHDPEETSPDILRLRELHAQMDGAVLDAYGWTDVQSRCEFLLDYEDEEDDEEEGRARKRKKPWRYRWPDAIRDEVLARLLKLNAERAEEEKLSGQAAGGKENGNRGKKAKGKRNKDAATKELCD